MIQKIKALSIALALICMTCLPVWAADYVNMSTDDLAGLRGTMQQVTQEERGFFHNEWQARVQ